MSGILIILKHYFFMKVNVKVLKIILMKYKCNTCIESSTLRHMTFKNGEGPMLLGAILPKI